MMHPIVLFEILIVFFFQFEISLNLQTILEEDSFAILQMDYGPGSFAFSLSQPLTVNGFFLKGFNDEFPVLIIAYGSEISTMDSIPLDCDSSIDSVSSYKFFCLDRVEINTIIPNDANLGRAHAGGQ